MYDVIIIGGGPGGYTSALYATRSKLKTLVIEKMSAGGQMATTEWVDNYPGFKDGVDGFELAVSMMEQAHRFGAETTLEEVIKVELKDEIKKVYTKKHVYEAQTVIIATGASPRYLDLPKEALLRGKGVAYCATCDGILYRNKTVVIVGGGNTAVADALFLSKIAKKIYLVHRRDTLRASKVYTDQLNKANVEFLWDSKVIDILGDERVSGVLVKNIKTNETKTIETDGIFVAIGRIPQTELFKDEVALSDDGFVIADENCHTSVDGVFAIGDVRVKKLRQVVTAVADGAIGAEEAQEYINEHPLNQDGNQ